MNARERVDPSPTVINFGLVGTNEVCQCGHKLYQYRENQKSKKELRCWECGLTFRINGDIEYCDSNGSTMKVGKHELAI